MLHLKENSRVRLDATFGSVQVGFDGIDAAADETFDPARNLRLGQLVQVVNPKHPTDFEFLRKKGMFLGYNNPANISDRKAAVAIMHDDTFEFRCILVLDTDQVSIRCTWSEKSKIQEFDAFSKRVGLMDRSSLLGIQGKYPDMPDLQAIGMDAEGAVSIDNPAASSIATFVDNHKDVFHLITEMDNGEIENQLRMVNHTAYYIGYLGDRNPKIVFGEVDSEEVYDNYGLARNSVPSGQCGFLVKKFTFLYPEMGEELNALEALFIADDSAYATETSTGQSL